MVRARGAWLLAGLLGRARAGNPIMLPSLGLADPHAHVWPGDPDTVFVYATHDCSPSGRGNCTASRGLGFRMDDWCVPPSRESCVESRIQVGLVDDGPPELDARGHGLAERRVLGDERHGAGVLGHRRGPEGRRRDLLLPLRGVRRARSLDRRDISP